MQHGSRVVDRSIIYDYKFPRLFEFNLLYGLQAAQEAFTAVPSRNNQRDADVFPFVMRGTMIRRVVEISAQVVLVGRRSSAIMVLTFQRF